MKLSKYIDHTLLKPEATEEQIKKLCEEAIQYDFASVCVNPTHIALCHKLLKNSDVKVCTVIGFPLGANTTAVKVFEAKDAINNGADELDMVINVGAVKDNNYQLVKDDIKALREATKGYVLKVIFETCLLTKEEIKKVAEICKELKVDYVKTSTGFSKGGATVEDVALMSSVVAPVCGVKASGGVRTYQDAKAMIDAGATRIGASAGIAIVSEEK